MLPTPVEILLHDHHQEEEVVQQLHPEKQWTLMHHLFIRENTFFLARFAVVEVSGLIGTPFMALALSVFSVVLIVRGEALTTCNHLLRNVVKRKLQASPALSFYSAFLKTNDAQNNYAGLRNNRPKEVPKKEDRKGGRKGGEGSWQHKQQMLWDVSGDRATSKKLFNQQGKGSRLNLWSLYTGKGTVKDVHREDAMCVHNNGST